MKIGILGTGEVGQALGEAFIAEGHDVMLSGRDPKNPKAREWAHAQGGRACFGSFADAAKWGEVIALATLGTATPEALRMAGPENFKGKLVLDATNPLDFSSGKPTLVGGLGTSGGEKNQAAIPGAHLVKAFNTVGHAHFYKPKFSMKPDMFICGNDPGAKTQVTKLLEDFGWNTIDVGDITTSHYLEALCLVWVLSAIPNNQWNQAFKLLRT